MSEEYTNVEIYKKWFRTRDRQGFCSITPWFEANKVAIDIGETKESGVQATKCFVDAHDFLVWAESVTNETAAGLYPERDQCPTPESFVSFGGRDDLSRIFKAHWWNDGGTKDKMRPKDPDNGFAFKNGHFKGIPMDTGGIRPDFSEIRSINMIKMNRVEVAVIAKRLDHAMIMWGCNPKNNWEKAFYAG